MSGLDAILNRSHGTTALHPSKDLLRRFVIDIAPAPQLRMPNEQYEELVTVCYAVLCDTVKMN